MPHNRLGMTKTPIKYVGITMPKIREICSKIYKCKMLKDVGMVGLKSKETRLSVK